VIERDDGKILLCQRPETKPYPGEWEFPGGKVETSESPHEALRRELTEELGLDVEVGRLLEQIIAPYPDGRTFRVQYYHVQAWTGSLLNNDFAQIRWMEPSELMSLPLLKGNLDFCSRLSNAGIAGLAAEGGTAK
jgi:8-oxo-dGTP diphosphatase